MSLRSSLLAAAALLFLGNAAAQAIEPDAAAKALGAALTEGSNVAASYKSAAFEGDDIVITGFSVTRTSEKQTITFENVLIEAPGEGDAGIFQSPRISFTNGTVTGEAKGSIAAAEVTDATILDPAEGKKNGFGGSILFRTAEASDIHMSREGEPGEITVAAISVESGDVVDGVAQSSKGSVDTITLSPEFIAARGIDPKALGYDALVFDLTWDSARDQAAKTMTINGFTLSFRDGGEISVSGMVGNVPDPRVLNDDQAAVKASATQVHRLTVRYDDESFAGRVLDYLAAQQNITRNEYAQQLTAALPFLLIPLNNPDFASQVATAVTGFLQEPHSITIEIAPSSPVSADEVLSLLRTAPGTIPDRLKATVTANAPAE